MVVQWTEVNLLVTPLLVLGDFTFDLNLVTTTKEVV